MFLRALVIEKLVQSQSRATVLFCMLMAVGISCVYYPSLSVPFYLDDRGSIVNNLAVHVGALDLQLQSSLRQSFFGYFIFCVMRSGSLFCKR